MAWVQRSFWHPGTCRSYRHSSFSWTMATCRRCGSTGRGGAVSELVSYLTQHTHTYSQPAQPPRHSPKILSLDLSLASSLSDKATEAVQAFGRVDILINNAGISSRSAVLETDLSVDRKLMEVNFFGTIALTKGEVALPPARPSSHHLSRVSHAALLPAMLEQGGGHIVVVSSLQGKIGIPMRSSCKQFCSDIPSASSHFDLWLLSPSLCCRCRLQACTAGLL